jgi:hypothetical protein
VVNGGGSFSCAFDLDRIRSRWCGCPNSSGGQGTPIPWPGAAWPGDGDAVWPAAVKERARKGVCSGPGDEDAASRCIRRLRRW